jgi:hypothetical protein
LLRSGGELGREQLCVGVASQPHVGVNEVRRGRQIGIGDLEVSQPPLLFFKPICGARSVSESEFELTKRRRGPNLEQLSAEARAERERLGDACAALRLPAAARLQPGKSDEREHQGGLLIALAGELDRVSVSGLGDGPAIRGGFVPGDQVQDER